MWFGIISIFPEMFNCIKHYGITSYAVKNNIFKLKVFNPKSYTKKNIYDKPYGGGTGVIMTYNPIAKSIEHAKKEKPNSLVVYLTPKGKLVDNNLILKLSKFKSIIFICGRYEEIDYRVIKQEINLEISLGDFILSGGEIPTMMIIDSISRLLPSVIKNYDSLNLESFNDNLLDYPQYTRPASIKTENVPLVLLKGNHFEISKWRYKQRLGYTFLNRPDLLYAKKLSKNDKLLLEEFVNSRAK